jgi:transcription elongation factor
MDLKFSIQLQQLVEVSFSYVICAISVKFDLTQLTVNLTKFNTIRKISMSRYACTR